MALIRWQKTAKTHVRQIFDYYKEHASLPVADGFGMAGFAQR